jgi:hypothetical protein
MEIRKSKATQSPLLFPVGLFFFGITILTIWLLTDRSEKTVWQLGEFHESG